MLNVKTRICALRLVNEIFTFSIKAILFFQGEIVQQFPELLVNLFVRLIAFLDLSFKYLLVCWPTMGLHSVLDNDNPIRISVALTHVQSHWKQALGTQC